MNQFREFASRLTHPTGMTLTNCPACGTHNADQSAQCVKCGHSLASPNVTTVSGNTPYQTIIVNTGESTAPTGPKNGLGTAGFVCSLVALFFGWIPGLGWLTWITGAVLSCIGLTRMPKGLAIAGVCISGFGLIMMIVVFAAAGAFIKANL